MAEITPLSPVAQAVAWAYDNTPEKETGNHRYHWLAAALRAAADQVAPEQPHEDTFEYCCDYAHSRTKDAIRHQLLSIAAELEGRQ